MNIQILDSWLREHLQTKSSAHKIAEIMSLTSVSIERVEKHGSDFLYDVEITTNRPDLASVIGLAREAAAVLPERGIPATFVSPQLIKPDIKNPTERIEIKNDPKLVNRVCAVIMEVTVTQSPKFIQERLEASGIRSINNLIDITNYVMRTIGHPSHVFDFDRLNTDSLVIREAKAGEEIVTLDKKHHILKGGEIVAVDDNDRIVDLLGIMGLENSVVTDQTKRILFFIDNNNPHHIRQASMDLTIRTDAAQLNEKGLDPNLAMDALFYGISLYETIADGKVLSRVYDIYPNKPKERIIALTDEKIQSVVGVPIPLKKSASILISLGFDVKITSETLTVRTPSLRGDVTIPEDLIEEIARVYGYDTIPSELPTISSSTAGRQDQANLWEKQIKHALKYWGFTEVYTYAMVSESLYDGPVDEAVKLSNPLTEEFVYMRNSLLLSVLRVAEENNTHEKLKLFEIANVYKKNGTDLPREERMLVLVMKRRHNISFFEAKGVIEQLANDLGIASLEFKQSADGFETVVSIANEKLGTIDVLDENLIASEIHFDVLIKHATTKKTYKPVSKFPPVIEDISLIVNQEVLTGDIIATIKKQSSLISNVTLLDRYLDKRTFHILYQDKTKNMTGDEVAKIRENVIDALKKAHGAKVV